MTKNKIKIGYASLSSCSGCQISFLDINEKILDVLAVADIVFSPVIMDYRDIPDDVDLMLVEGSVATEDDLEFIQEIRKKTKYLVAIGACACFGGIPGMRNFFDKDDVLKSIYPCEEGEDCKDILFEGPTGLLPKVKNIPSIVKTDFLVPGCPPLPENFLTVVQHYPDFEKIELPSKTLCVECELKKDKLLSPIREFTSLKILHPYEMNTQENDELCFLEKGVLCMGVATRAGCGGRCVKHGVPCRGCFGPPIRLGFEDQGAGFISAISSILPTGRLLAKEDMLGLVYRYSLSIITELQHFSHEQEDL
ncbi:MAG: NADH-quinone oxidoreductase subunit B family protein [Candidatus Hodarchaeales archaeon]|jgi:F420-non-reducing hydrogenase small subunit